MMFINQDMSKAQEIKKLSELDLRYCSPKCELSELNECVKDGVIMAQQMAGFQFTITSAYRSQAYERSKGRKGTSSHCKGLAVDISTRDSHTRFKVVAALLYAGWPRIGIGKTFVHADMDETKAHPIIFHYYDPQNT